LGDAPLNAVSREGARLRKSAVEIHRCDQPRAAGPERIRGEANRRRNEAARDELCHRDFTRASAEATAAGKSGTVSRDQPTGKCRSPSARAPLPAPRVAAWSLDAQATGKRARPIAACEW